MDLQPDEVVHQLILLLNKELLGLKDLLEHCDDYGLKLLLREGLLLAHPRVHVLQEWNVGLDPIGFDLGRLVIYHHCFPLFVTRVQGLDHLLGPGDVVEAGVELFASLVAALASSKAVDCFLIRVSFVCCRFCCFPQSFPLVLVSFYRLGKAFPLFLIVCIGFVKAFFGLNSF